MIIILIGLIILIYSLAQFSRAFYYLYLSMYSEDIKEAKFLINLSKKFKKGI